MVTRIFVSYAREDQLAVGGLVHFLRAAGYDVWFDKDRLHAGQDWKLVIESEIARADLLIICLSPHSVNKTGFVQKEMRLALEQMELRPASQVYIIPVSLGECEIPKALDRWHVLALEEPDARQRLLLAINNATALQPAAPVAGNAGRPTPIR